MLVWTDDDQADAGVPEPAPWVALAVGVVVGLGVTAGWIVRTGWAVAHNPAAIHFLTGRG